MSIKISLPALRTFVEVARLGGMKQAAARLGVTPGAVSQQVRLVEQRVGVVLFDRMSKSLRLTEEGQRLLDALNVPFRQIDETLADFHHRKPSRQTLVVTTVPSFASSWLVPRLGEFSEQFPDIEVHVETSPTLRDLRREPIDVAIRHGSGHYPGLEVTHLMTPLLIPIISPKMLANRGPLRSPSDFLSLPLLQDRNRSDWRLWLRSHGVPDADGKAAQGAGFQDDALLIRAAASDQGVALVRDIYAEEALSSGAVVIAIDRALQTSSSYYFVTTSQSGTLHRVNAFKAWLRDQIEKRPCRSPLSNL